MCSPWAQVAGVAVDRRGGLRIQLRGGQTFVVFGFGGSVIGMNTGSIRARKACDGIKAMMTAAAGSTGDGEAVTSSFDIHWKALLAIWAATVTLSIGRWLLAGHRDENVGGGQPAR
jgi:hypothetical protein